MLRNPLISALFPFLAFMLLFPGTTFTGAQVTVPLGTPGPCSRRKRHV